MQGAPGGARDVIGPGQDLCGRITPTMLYQEITERRLEVQSRIICQDLLNHLRRDLIEAET